MKTGILLNNTSTECHIGSKTVIGNISTLCKKNGIKLVASYTRHEIMSFIDYPDDFIKILKNCDIVIINGEGSLHHHPRRNTRWFQFVMKLLPNNQTSVLINTLWQDMGRLENAEQCLDKLSLISVRESYSYNNLIKMYPKKEKISIVPDMIFGINPNLPTIGYGDSVHLKLRGIMKKYPNYYPLSSIHKGTYLNIKDFNMPSTESYLSWLKSLELYVTGRFHGVCLASLAGIPFLALKSNSHKVEGILHDMKCEELLIDSLNDVNKNIDRAKELITRAQGYAIYAKKQIEELFKKIGKLI